MLIHMLYFYKMGELKGLAPSTTRFRQGCSANLAYSSNLVLIEQIFKLKRPLIIQHIC